MLFKHPQVKGSFECSMQYAEYSKPCSNTTSEIHLLVGLCLAQLLSAVLNNVRYTGTFLPVSSILKFRCCFAASCLHIANVICDSFLYILQLVVEVKCVTRFLPLFFSLVFFSFEICCMRPHFLQIGSCFNPVEQKFIYLPPFWKKALLCAENKR